MSKPNWQSNSTTHGGAVADIPLPHVRKFPKKGLKRRVDVSITTFVGTCAGAKHWRARVDEEHNPIWDSEAKTWRSAWDDLDGKGTVIDSPNLFSEKSARDWVQWMLRAFDPKKYEFHYAMHSESPKWFYAREGD